MLSTAPGEDPTGVEDVLALQRQGVGSPSLQQVQPVLEPGELAAARALVDATNVSAQVAEYVVALVRGTRELPSVALGASPRAAVHLLAAAKGRARLAGRDFVTPDDVAEIARRMLRGVIDVMRSEHTIDLVIEASAIDALVAGGGFDPALGARPMRRTVGRLVEAPLASLVLSGGVRRGDRVIARGEDGVVRFERVEAEDVAAE